MLGELDVPYPLVALTIAFALKKSSDGHVLVFLPGWDEIKKVADILLDPGQCPLLGMNFNDASQFSVHYLHSSIPAAEQKEVFRKPAPGVRRIILATNIAETSVTIPDVVYVVDTGRVKEKRYDPERHMSSLVSAWVGASNLGQRAGRAGRHRSGEYFGILSKRRFASLEPNQMVEMKRSDLSDVVMHVKALNLGEVEEVLGAAIEPPEPSRIVAALETLHMLGALDWNKNLTSLGRVLLQLPTDAAIGKLCLYGSFFRCLDSALTLAAVLTNRDPFLAPLAMKREADEIKNSWAPPAFRSDPLAIVSAYNQWSAMDDRGEYVTANRFCQDNFLSKLTLLQIKQVKGHLLQSLDQAGVIAVSAGDRYVPRGFRGRAEVPMVLRENDNSLPLLAALIAVASAPNFAIRTSEKTCRTSQDKVGWRRCILANLSDCVYPPLQCQLAPARAGRARGAERVVPPCREAPVRLRGEESHGAAWKPERGHHQPALGHAPRPHDVHAVRRVRAVRDWPRPRVRRLAPRDGQPARARRRAAPQVVPRHVHAARL
jgi:hypothetical protein